MMIHAVHRRGIFSRGKKNIKKIGDIKKHYNKHQNKPTARFIVVPRFQNHSKDMKSMERHIQVSITVLSANVRLHEEKCVGISLTEGYGSICEC